MTPIDGKKLRRVVQAVGTVLVWTMDRKGNDFLIECEEVLRGSTVAKWWNNLEVEEQLLLFNEARKRVRQELGGIKNRKRRVVAY
jgi:hypothetical protein